MATSKDDSLCDEYAQEDMLSITIDDELFQIFLAEDDFNRDKKTLFATHLWSGSRLIAQFVLRLKREELINKTCVEMGSGAGLPSLACLRKGCSRVIATDYPAEKVLKTLELNLSRGEGCKDRYGVISHIWGEDVTNIIVLNHNQLFDIAIASECLWRHECHEALAKSLSSLLAIDGHVYLSYSHHVPGLEQNDDEFFVIAERYHLILLSKQEVIVKHMWSDKQVPSYICILKKTE